MSNTSVISKIPHPLLEACPGTSQQGKILETLKPENIKIDDQEAQDLLNFIYQFAGQVNFYDETLQQYDWQPFFQNSLPFVLARISKVNLVQLKADYDELVVFVKTNYNTQTAPVYEPQSLQLIFDFLYDEIFIPLTRWQQQFTENKSSFGDVISGTIRRNLKTALKNYIKLFNGAASIDGTGLYSENYNIVARDFTTLNTEQIWGLKPEDLAASDTSFYDNNTLTLERLEAILENGQPNLNTIINKAIEVLKALSQKAPHYIKESLIPKYEEQQQVHLPQLGLLYTFMELSKYFKIDVNDLSTKHLDFFYKKVLNIKEQPEVPDKAHLVFEVQKHVKNPFELKAGTLIKDGKDANNKDIFFQIDEDIVIDKAQVAYLQTLHINYIDVVVDDGITDEEATCSDEATICPFVEGIYMAPVANAANGVEATTPPLSWATLGARFSKEIIGDNELPERYPKAELGFVLASPVLYLQEGKRKIDIRLCCKIEDIVTDDEKEIDVDDFADLEMQNLNETYYGLTLDLIDEIKEQLQIQVKPKIDGWAGPRFWRNSNNSGWSEAGNLLSEVLSDWGASINQLPHIFFDLLYNNLIDRLTEYLYGIDICPLPASHLESYVFIDLTMPSQINGFYTQNAKDLVECLIDEGIKCIIDLTLELIRTTALSQKIFNIYLSGEKEWILVKPEQITNIDLKVSEAEGIGGKGSGFECPPQEEDNDNENDDGSTTDTEDEEPTLPEPTEFACPPGTDYELCITIELDESIDPVTFFDEEALKEPLGTTDPVAKILVNSDIKVIVDSCEYVPCCSLENCKEGEKNLPVSLYHYFRYFKVLDSCIDVEVCGLKNFIVQNDENLQDVNSPIYPFGARPEVIDFEIVNQTEEPSTTTPDTEVNLIGPSFYIGSKEIFCKDWDKVWVNLEWKSKPSDFNEYYQAYNVVHEGGVQVYGLNEEGFEMNVAVLDDGKWCREEPNGRCIDRDTDGNVEADDQHPDTGHNNRMLFQDDSKLNDTTLYSNPCVPVNPVEQSIEICNTDFLIQRKFRELNTNLTEYRTDTLNGFIRLTLENQDFLHKDYAFVLARQMMALGRYPIAFQTAIYVDSENGGIFNFQNFSSNIDDIQDLVEDICKKIDPPGGLESLISSLENLLCADNNSSSIKSRLGGVITMIDTLKGEIEEVAEDIFGPNAPNVRELLDDLSDSSSDAIGFLDTAIDDLQLSPTPNVGSAETNITAAKDKLNLTLPLSTPTVLNLVSTIIAILDDTNPLNPDVKGKLSDISNDITDIKGEINTIIGILCDSGTIQSKIDDISTCIESGDSDNPGIKEYALEIKNITESLENTDVGDGDGEILSGSIEVPIPNEPWTPIIKEMSLDYTAKAIGTDIELIHIYPFDNTYKQEALNPQPMLVPTLLDEGTLFIGLKDLTPGSSVNLLFQLAEATADTECDRADIKWHYLKNNRWNNPLRDGFEIAEDGTNGLTRSGIVKIAVPEDIPNKDYTIMPNPDPEKEPISWLKVSARRDIAAICETVGIYTQAVIASFKNDGNTRNEMLLPAGSLARLARADSSIKKVNQYYDTFGGRLAEVSNNFYHRVSERLRHKGRGIQLFDYERLVLQHFPEILMARCVTHTFGLSAKKYRSDFALAPGFVMLAVIPNLKILSSGNVLEPRVSTSLLDDIQTMLADKISPFTRLKVVNPRYEKVDVQVKVKFKKKITNVAFYKAKLAETLTQFMAPWTKGDNLDRLIFGRNLSASELVHFIECQPYIDFICSLDLTHEEEKKKCYDIQGASNSGEQQTPSEEPPTTLIAPLTARSILTVGTITVEHLIRDCDKFSDVEDYTCNEVTGMKN